ncbi:hypothetical protein GQ55_8G123200 [Panicum hallii var. hallii]|uniref:DUF4220 domain-containing protein n=1 Tax=Panicum hallii var. hallii TaxID=1504633 RepID=A0A2T7CMS1_9POAL|nr:hypothetical protein GQ55_8G123200 [Panicum hallii var. hallii]
MAGGNFMATNCSGAALKRCSSQIVCAHGNPEAIFQKTMHLWRVNVLLLAGAVLAGVIVGIGAYRQRYRHHPITRFVFLGATTLFLPILSSVVSTVRSRYSDFAITYEMEDDLELLSAVVARCHMGNQVILVLWAFFVQIMMINTSTVVSTDDREGPSKGPPFEVLVQGAWTLYLGASLMRVSILLVILVFLVAPIAVVSAKLALKFYAFEKARCSFALGRNPGLIFGYMRQLRAQEANQNGVPPVSEGTSPPPPPKLLVMGEEENQVKVQPRGYEFKDDSGSIVAVTLDRVWQMDSLLPISTPQQKDWCLSFALFKLLRCRFARYNLTTAGSMGTLTFFRSLLLQKDDEHDGSRVFRVIADEHSFLHDYYYSSLPISYSKRCLPILSIFTSLLSICYCIFIASIAISDIIYYSAGSETQVRCRVWCIEQSLAAESTSYNSGRHYYDYVPLLFLLVSVVIAEVRDMASYICSNWTKVALICRYVNRASSQHSFCMQKWVSLLVLHPRKTPPVLARRLLCLPDQKWKVKVPAAVKVGIIEAVRGLINGRCLSNGAESLQESELGQSFHWACNGNKGTSETILIWHIATCILEVKHPYQTNQEQTSSQNSISNHKIAATHLSRYCAYLMSWCPDLLSDNKEWIKSRYEAVKMEAGCALAELPAAGSVLMPEDDEYQQLVDHLSENSKHEVLNDGVKLGKQLVEMINEEETAWKLLANFWSEMILHVAPSENLKGHSEAIARGGELVTLLWALLFHAGIVSRPGEDEGGDATSDVSFGVL